MLALHYCALQRNDHFKRYPSIYQLCCFSHFRHSSCFSHFRPFATDGKSQETGVGTDAALPMLARIRSQHGESTMVTWDSLCQEKDDWQLWRGRGPARSFQPGGLPTCPHAFVVILEPHFSCEAVWNLNRGEDGDGSVTVEPGLGGGAESGTLRSNWPLWCEHCASDVITLSAVLISGKWMILSFVPHGWASTWPQASTSGSLQTQKWLQSVNVLCTSFVAYI